MTAADNLSTNRISQLLAAIGSQPAEDASSAEGGHVAEHDWRQPHYFDSEQIARLSGFTGQLAAAITPKIAHFFGNDCSVAISSTTFHFADSLGEQTRNNPAYYLAFGATPQNPAGCLAMPAETAMTWVALLLGDAEPQTDPNRRLSQLEESLLFDLARTTVDVLVTSLKDHHKFQPAAAITPQPPIRLAGADEMCKITFEAKKAQSQAPSQAYFIVPCSILAPIASATAQTQTTISPEQLSEIIVPHLHEIQVSVSVRLTSTTLSLGEIMSLGPNDIVLLDKPVDEPAEVLIEGRTAFYALPARSEDRLAVVITEPPVRLNNKVRGSAQGVCRPTPNPQRLALE